MIEIKHMVEIAKPVDQVFAYISDPANEAKWQADLVEAGKTSEGPVGVGTTGMEVRKMMGRRMETHWECTEFEVDKKMSFKSTSGPMAVQGSYTLEPTDGGTRLAFWLQLQPSLLMRPFQPLIAGSARKQITRDFASLKGILEA